VLRVPLQGAPLPVVEFTQMCSDSGAPCIQISGHLCKNSSSCDAILVLQAAAAAVARGVSGMWHGMYFCTASPPPLAALVLLVVILSATTHCRQHRAPPHHANVWEHESYSFFKRKQDTLSLRCSLLRNVAEPFEACERLLKRKALNRSHRSERTAADG
jgi:hypothetical protein